MTHGHKVGLLSRQRPKRKTLWPVLHNHQTPQSLHLRQGNLHGAWQDHQVIGKKSKSLSWKVGSTVPSRVREVETLFVLVQEFHCNSKAGVGWKEITEFFFHYKVWLRTCNFDDMFLTERLSPLAGHFVTPMKSCGTLFWGLQDQPRL